MLSIAKRIDENHVKVLLTIKPNSTLDEAIEIRKAYFDFILFPNLEEEYYEYGEIQYQTYLNYYLTAKSKLSAISSIDQILTRTEKISKASKKRFKKLLNKTVERDLLDLKSAKISDDLLKSLESVFYDIELCHLSTFECEINSFIESVESENAWDISFRNLFLGLVRTYLDQKFWDLKKRSLQQLVKNIISSDLKENIYPTYSRLSAREEIITEPLPVGGYQEYWIFLEQYWKKNENELRKRYQTGNAIANFVVDVLKKEFPNRDTYPSNSAVRNRLGFKKN